MATKKQQAPVEQVPDEVVVEDVAPEPVPAPATRTEIPPHLAAMDHVLAGAPDLESRQLQYEPAPEKES